MGHIRRQACRLARLPVRQGGIVLGVFQLPSGGAALQSLQPQEVGNRHYDGSLVAQVDHVVRAGVRDGDGIGRLDGHGDDTNAGH